MTWTDWLVLLVLFVTLGAVLVYDLRIRRRDR